LFFCKSWEAEAEEVEVLPLEELPSPAVEWESEREGLSLGLLLAEGISETTSEEVVEEVVGEEPDSPCCLQPDKRRERRAIIVKECFFMLAPFKV